MVSGSIKASLQGRWIKVSAVLLLVLLLGAAISLWARHGAAVFFDLLAAGIAYCF